MARERRIEQEARALNARLRAEREAKAREEAQKRAARAASERDDRAAQWAKAAGASGNDVQVFAKIVSAGGGEERHLLPGIGASNSIAEVKEAIAMATGVPVEKQTLVLNGAVLSNNQAALVDSLTGFSSEVSILVLAR